MPRTPKKPFFQEPTKAEIKKLELISADSDLIERVFNQEPGIIIEIKLIPNEYENARKFLKHGPDIKIPRIHSLEDGSIPVPVRLREETFNKTPCRAFAKYSTKPFIGTDLRTRNIFLDQCLEAERITTNSYHAFPKQSDDVCLIDVHPYDIAKRVAKEGATIPVRVLSRRKNVPAYEFNLISVPVINNENKFAIVNSLASQGYGAKAKQYSFGYNYLEDKESSNYFNWYAHEIAAYWKIAELYWSRDKNIIPLEMNPFAMPTQFTVNFYKNLISRVLIRDESMETKDNLRKLNKAEINIMLWGLVHKYGHDKTFFATEKLRDYDWAL